MKKILIGSYLVIILGIIIVLGNSSILEKKNSNEAAAGEKVYKDQCLICHGETGKGEGRRAGTALNNQDFLNSVSNNELFHYIKYGRDGTGMPAYGPRLSEKELKDLVIYIRNWETKNINFETPKSFTGDYKNGLKQYNLYCLNCHGAEGAGMQKMGPSLSNHQYLKYTTDEQIWIATAYGREDTRMGPSLRGLEGVRQLSKEDITDIVTYLRTLGHKNQKKE